MCVKRRGAELFSHEGNREGGGGGDLSGGVLMNSCVMQSAYKLCEVLYKKEKKSRTSLIISPSGVWIGSV